MARAKTGKETATAADPAPKSQPPPVTATTGDIARRAYELYFARGCEPGHDVEDWLQAERELSHSRGA